MKKAGGMMYARQTKTTKQCKCTKCSKELTPATAFYYVDSCNYAITNNSKPYCLECYKETYKK